MQSVKAMNDNERAAYYLGMLTGLGVKDEEKTAPATTPAQRGGRRQHAAEAAAAASGGTDAAAAPPNVGTGRGGRRQRASTTSSEDVDAPPPRRSGRLQRAAVISNDDGSEDDVPAATAEPFDGDDEPAPTSEEEEEIGGDEWPAGVAGHFAGDESEEEEEVDGDNDRPTDSDDDVQPTESPANPRTSRSPTASRRSDADTSYDEFDNLSFYDSEVDSVSSDGDGPCYCGIYNNYQPPTAVDRTSTSPAVLAPSANAVEGTDLQLQLQLQHPDHQGTPGGTPCGARVDGRRDEVQIFDQEEEEEESSYPNLFFFERLDRDGTPSDGTPPTNDPSRWSASPNHVDERIASAGAPERLDERFVPLLGSQPSVPAEQRQSDGMPRYVISATAIQHIDSSLSKYRDYHRSEEYMWGFAQKQVSCIESFLSKGTNGRKRIATVWYLCDLPGVHYYSISATSIQSIRDCLREIRRRNASEEISDEIRRYTTQLMEGIEYHLTYVHAPRMPVPSLGSPPRLLDGPLDYEGQEPSGWCHPQDDGSTSKASEQGDVVPSLSRYAHMDGSQGNALGGDCMFCSACETSSHLSRPLFSRLPHEQCTRPEPRRCSTVAGGDRSPTRRSGKAGSRRRRRSGAAGGRGMGSAKGGAGRGTASGASYD
jgi:hypothetical protein